MLGGRSNSAKGDEMTDRNSFMNRVPIKSDGIVGVHLENGVRTDTDLVKLGSASKVLEVDLVTDSKFMSNTFRVGLEEAMIDHSLSMLGEGQDVA